MGRSCERMDTKGTEGVPSPGRISLTARIRARCDERDACARLNSQRFVVTAPHEGNTKEVVAARATSSHAHSRLAIEGKEKKSPAHSTSRARERKKGVCTRIVCRAFPSAVETNVRTWKSFETTKTRPSHRDPFMSHPIGRFYLRNSYSGHPRERN